MYTDIINKINNTFKNKTKILIVNKKKNEKKVIDEFIKLNVIKFVKIYKNKYILYLNYLNNNKIFKIKNLYKISKLNIIKLKNLKKIKFQNNILLITSNKGILNNFDLIKKKNGGTILIILWN